MKGGSETGRAGGADPGLLRAALLSVHPPREPGQRFQRLLRPQEPARSIYTAPQPKPVQAIPALHTDFFHPQRGFWEAAEEDVARLNQAR